MNSNFRNFALWVIIFLLVLALVTLFQNPGQRSGGSEIAYSQLLSEVDAGRITNVVISGPEISGTYSDGRTFTTYAPNDPMLVTKLQQKGVQISAKPQSRTTALVPGAARQLSCRSPSSSAPGSSCRARCRGRAAGRWASASRRPSC